MDTWEVGELVASAFAGDQTLIDRKLLTASLRLVDSSFEVPRLPRLPSSGISMPFVSPFKIACPISSKHLPASQFTTEESGPELGFRLLPENQISQSCEETKTSPQLQMTSVQGAMRIPGWAFIGIQLTRMLPRTARTSRAEPQYRA